MQENAESELVRTLKHLAEKLGLDISAIPDNSGRVNINIKSLPLSGLKSNETCTQVLFRAEPRERALIAAKNFASMLGIMGAREIQTSAVTVTFSHFTYMPALNTHLAKLLDFIRHTEASNHDISAYYFEHKQGAENLRQKLYDHLLEGPAATTEWRSLSQRNGAGIYSGRS